MKHIYCFLIMLAAVLFPAEAQQDASRRDGGEAFNHPLNESTRPRFDAVCADLAKNPVIKGGFEQTRTIGRLNRSMVSKGDFIIAAELGIVWDTLTPFPSTMTVGRDYILQSTPSGARTKLDARGNETFLRFADIISAIFTGNSRQLLENFAVYFAESGGSWTIALIPGEKSIGTFAARIVMSGESTRAGGNQNTVIRVITLYEQNGDTITYRLSNHSYPGTLNARERSLFAAR
ncbi:MAG: outer membrane lipoprotein carrier protein LolA [Treponema sp.]|nr:outer membrane lipoprotein carrier protein LolA [Treponema sp.]